MSLEKSYFNYKVILIIILFSLSTRVIASESEHKVDVNKLIKETQIVDDRDKTLTIAWWMPTEFWKASFEKEKSLSADDITNMLKQFDPYIMFAVVDGNVSPFGSIYYKSDNEILSTIQVIDKDSNIYLPVLEDQLGGDLKILLGTFKPVLANMIGAMRENMNFYLFPAYDKNNNKIADIYKDGNLTILIGEKKLSWELPLDSVLPTKNCSKCNKSMSGKFKFCPWDGTKLKTKNKRFLWKNTPRGNGLK